MTDVAGRIAAATAAGDVAMLATLAIELANENARLAGRAAALEEAERERKEKQAERVRRHRNATQRDVTLQTVTERDVTPGSPPSPSPSLLSPTPPNNSSPPSPPSPGREAPKPRSTRPPAPWMGLMQRAWTLGTLPPGSATLLQPVVAAVGPEETAHRLANFCEQVDPEYASVRTFVAKHAHYADQGRPAVDPETGQLNAIGIAALNGGRR